MSRIIVIATVFLFGCSIAQADGDHKKIGRVKPLVMIRLNNDAYPPPNSPPFRGGLVFALCSNGRAARAASEDEAGTSMQLGEVSASTLDKWKEITSGAGYVHLAEECERQAVDIGTANIEIWQNASRKVLRCTWPPTGEQGNQLQNAMWQSELERPMPSSVPSDIEWPCK